MDKDRLSDAVAEGLKTVVRVDHSHGGIAGFVSDSGVFVERRSAYQARTALRDGLIQLGFILYPVSSPNGSYSTYS